LCAGNARSLAGTLRERTKFPKPHQA
jgi:hypothetical protein